MTAVQRTGRAAVAVVLLLLACSCTAGRTSGPHRDNLLGQTPAGSATVTTVLVNGLGRVLADGHGRVLYMFPPDAGRGVTCTGACAGIWPPFAVRAGTAVTAGADVIRVDLSTLADPNTGGRVVTYAGYPLYRYSGDVRAGQANGQALYNNAGPWYVLDADGRPVTTDPGQP